MYTKLPKCWVWVRTIFWKKEKNMSEKIFFFLVSKLLLKNKLKIASYKV